MERSCFEPQNLQRHEAYQSGTLNKARSKRRIASACDCGSLKRMILVTASSAQRLVYFKYVGKVTAAEMHAKLDEIGDLLLTLKPGFRLLSDFEQLDAMENDCVPEIGRVMDLLKGRGLEMVVRIVPDPRKDLGLNILAVFHYGREVRVITCDSTTEAFQVLKL